MKMLGLENLGRVILEARDTLKLNDQKFEIILKKLDLPMPFDCYKVPCFKLAKLMDAMCVPHEWTLGHYNQAHRKNWIEKRKNTGIFEVSMILDRSSSKGKDERAY